MTDFERRALLGDRQAQEECTRSGIVLPCPFCGSHKIRTSNWGMWRCWCPECRAKSDDCLRERDAIKQWNTRPAPPIGRCKDCEHYTLLGHCKIHSQEPDEYGNGAYVEMLLDDFCSYFEPKSQLKKLATLQPLDGVGTKEEAGKNHVPGTAPERSNRNG